LRNVKYEIEPADVGGYLLRCCDPEGGIYDIRSDHLIPTVELAKEIAQAVEDMNPLPWPPPGEWWDSMPPGYLTLGVLDAVVEAKLQGEEISFAEAERRSFLMGNYLRNPAAEKAVRDIMEGVVAAERRGEKIDWAEVKRRIDKAEGR
jgi:hypothetical protein